MQGRCGLFYESYGAEERLLRGKFQWARMLFLLAALAASPFFLSRYMLSVLVLCNIAVVGSLALMILTGFCGQISLGHGAFMGVGAFASAWFSTRGVPFVPALFLGGCCTAAVGMLFGLPSAKLKGIYLAIATLAAQLILEYCFLHMDPVTGGSTGVSVDPPKIFGFAFDTDGRMLWLTLAFAVLAIIATSNLIRSKPGRAFISIRDHYLAAEIVGVNLFLWKTIAFGLSAFMAGIAGGLWAHYTQIVTPEPFNIGLSISYLAMIVIGGMGSVQGAVFGAIFITLLPEGLTWLAGLGEGVFPNLVEKLSALKEGVFGLTLVLFLIFEPEGLARRWRLFKAYWKLYPFAH